MQNENKSDYFEIAMKFIFIITILFIAVLLIINYFKQNKTEALKTDNLPFANSYFGIDSIEIKTYNADVTLIMEQNKDRDYIRLNENTNNNFYLIEKNHTLIIDEKIKSPCKELKVFIFKDELKNLIVNTKQGKITLESVIAKDTMLSSKFDNIFVFKAITDNLIVDSISSSITIENTVVSNILNTTSTSGDIKIKSLKAKNINLGTISGDIKVELEESNPLEVDFSSISGDINLYLSKKQLIKNINKVVGGNFVFSPDSSNLFSACTVSGDISANYLSD